jgi:hypothetical protein
MTQGDMQTKTKQRSKSSNGIESNTLIGEALTLRCLGTSKVQAEYLVYLFESIG